MTAWDHHFSSRFVERLPRRRRPAGGGRPVAGRDRGAGPRQPGAQPMNTTLLITGAIAFAGALLLAWLAYRQAHRNKKS